MSCEFPVDASVLSEPMTATSHEISLSIPSFSVNYDSGFSSYRMDGSGPYWSAGSRPGSCGFLFTVGRGYGSEMGGTIGSSSHRRESHAAQR